jgi:hypothetical protein
MIRLLVVLAVGAALLAPTAQAARNPSARTAAHATRACLVKLGWSARLTDGGRTVAAKAPRKLAAYPYRPWYSVTFYPKGFSPRFAEIRMKLNRHEARAATYCRKAGWR